MAKCLITKLSGSTGNNELLRLGEMRIRIAKVDNPTKATQGFSIEVNKPVTIEIVGNGYFTDETLTTNKGKTITLNQGFNDIFVSNDGVEIAILDKYSITKITYYTVKSSASNPYARNISLDISDLKYSTSVVSLDLLSTQATGNIGDLKNLTSLVMVELSGTGVSGNVGDLKNLTSLSTLDLVGTNISGNVGDLKNLTSLSTLGLSNNKVPLTIHIDDLSTLTNCKLFFFKNSKLTGDLASLPASCRFISLSHNVSSSLTWSTRSSSSKILAIEGNALLNNIDKMLEDQAKCQIGISDNDPMYLKKISVLGTRTSASDAAVATLQQKGYTVSITPA